VEGSTLRRGIAPYGFLARLAPVALGLGLLAGDVPQRAFAPCCVYESPPPPKVTATDRATGLFEALPARPYTPGLHQLVTGPARGARGLTLRPQDLTGARLIRCRLVGDWRGKTLRGARLWECDLSGAILGRTYAERISSAGGRVEEAAGSYNPELRRLYWEYWEYWESQATDLCGGTYDALTRWPAGVDPQARGARLVK
jgi:hypothetical protein